MFLISGGGWSGCSGLLGIPGTSGRRLDHPTLALGTVISGMVSGVGLGMG